MRRQSCSNPTVAGTGSSAGLQHGAVVAATGSSVGLQHSVVVAATAVLFLHGGTVLPLRRLSTPSSITRSRLGENPLPLLQQSKRGTRGVSSTTVAKSCVGPSRPDLADTEHLCLQAPPEQRRNRCPRSGSRAPR
uniref:Uncharacterized protein n=1 Tax=Zea mays TaxID=4577 RepID=C0P5D2_MAIZE|nr:unknown [Zea mays]